MNSGNLICLRKFQMFKYQGSPTEPNEDVHGVFLTDSKRTTRRSPTGSATGSALGKQNGSHKRTMPLPTIGWPSINTGLKRLDIDLQFFKVGRHGAMKGINFIDLNRLSNRCFRR